MCLQRHGEHTCWEGEMALDELRPSQLSWFLIFTFAGVSGPNKSHHPGTACTGARSTWLSSTLAPTVGAQSFLQSKHGVSCLHCKWLN